MTKFMSADPEDIALIKFTESALAGSAAHLAMRHDFTPERFAKLALQIARAAIVELKND